VVNDDRQVKSGLGEPVSYRFEAPSAARAARTAAEELRLSMSVPQSRDELSAVQSSGR
jgi:hypothetical protein